jgi:hypothetical protein
MFKYLTFFKDPAKSVYKGGMLINSKKIIEYSNIIEQTRLNHVKVNKKLNEDSLEELSSCIDSDIHNLEIKAFNNKSYNPSMIRKNKPFDNVLIEFLIGKLLGDGFARKGSSKINENATGTSFTFAQCSKQLEYIENMRSFLLEYNLCGDRIPHLERANSIKTNKDKLNFKYSLYTKLNVYFDKLYDALYRYDPIAKHYIKGLYNKEFIYNNFSAFSLALFTMDDGTNQNGHIKFCTDNFTKTDCE